MILRTTIGAFLLSNESAEAVEALKEDRLFLRSTFDVHGDGIPGAVSHLSENPTPALLIVETKAQGDALYDELNSLADVCAPNTYVILIGVQNDIVLYRDLVREGISDYLIGPATAEQLRESIEEIYKDTEGKSGRSIAFIGAAGGVGSSTLACNAAYELAQAYEDDVIFVDLDIANGIASLAFNFQPRQTIVDVMSKSDRLDEPFIEQFLVECEKNLTVLPSPSSLTTGMQINVESYTAIMKYLKRMADFVVLDVPHVWDAWVSDVLADVEDLVLVARPDLPNLRNAKNLVEFMGPKRSDVPTRLILNQVGAAKGADLSGKEFKDALAMDTSLSIPYDPEAFGKSMNSGEMMSKASPKSKATEGIKELAKIISARDVAEEGEKKKGLGGLFKKEKKDKKKKD